MAPPSTGLRAGFPSWHPRRLLSAWKQLLTEADFGEFADPTAAVGGAAVSSSATAAKRNDDAPARGLRFVRVVRLVVTRRKFNPKLDGQVVVGPDDPVAVTFLVPFQNAPKVTAHRFGYPASVEIVADTAKQVTLKPGRRSSSRTRRR